MVASGIANCDLNPLLGTTLECLNLTLGGTFTKAMITLIQLKANGKVIWESDGTKTDALENPECCADVVRSRSCLPFSFIRSDGY